MSKIKALVKREFIDSKSGILITPAILSAFLLVMLTIAALGFTNVTIEGHRFDGQITNVAGFLDTVQSEAAREGKTDEIPSVVAAVYWVISAPLLIALPVYIFFSLVYAMYEEKKDKSILFWKSMPVSDTQEVGARFGTTIFVSTLIYVGFAIALQFASALVISLISLVQGGDVALLWPVGLMITSAFGMIFSLLFQFLWALPLFAWLIMISGETSRLPILFAVLPIGLIMFAEKVFFETNIFAEWVVLHMGGWRDMMESANTVLIEKPSEFFIFLTGAHMTDQIVTTITSPSFYLGLIIAGGLLFRTVQARKAAL